ncbi:unnamed protein product [Effrenium voratum]|nr:unnamed protein product [Effrenium voratum]
MPGAGSTRADLLAAGRAEDGDGEPAKSDWEDLQAAVLAGDTKALQVADAVMAQAKSRTDAERMEPLGGTPGTSGTPATPDGTTACDFRGADFGCLFCRGQPV